MPGKETGLDALQSLFGRLNGKSDQELARAQTAREDVRRGAYVEQRWGTMRFVSGGLLVGTRIDDHDNQAVKTIEGSGGQDEEPPDVEAVVLDEEAVRPTKRKKSKRHKRAVEPQEDAEAVEHSPLPPPEEKVKVKRKKSREKPEKNERREKKEKRTKQTKKERHKSKHSRSI